MTASLITSEVDFEADGKHCGFLRLPHSVHRSAYGWIPIPVVSIRNGEGPTILLMSGNHGDEYEGQIALTKLSHELVAENVQGQILLLTMANFPAAKAGQRTSPLDGGNLNRSFPGNPAGTPTEMIAHYIEEILLPRCDYLIDLHSGGSSLFYPATLLRGMGCTEDETNKLIILQQAFDLPYTWVFTSGGGPNSTARTAMGGANRKGVVSVMAELGGGGFISPDILAQAERGIRRVLHSLNMLPRFKPGAIKGTRELNVAGSVYAYDAGLFEPFKDISNSVDKGEIIGQICSPDVPWQAPISIASPYAGMVLCKRMLGHVERGDAVFQIARDAT